jgi:hypothetical protein
MESATQEQQSQELATKKGGAPRGNRNSLRHGLRAAGLPKGFAWLERELRTLRKALERAVVEKHGEVDVLAAASISTAIRGEQAARLIGRWLAKECDSMTASDRLNYTREIVKASESRDRAIRSLDLEPTAQQKSKREFNRAYAAISNRSPTPKGT